MCHRVLFGLFVCVTELGHLLLFENGLSHVLILRVDVRVIVIVRLQGREAFIRRDALACFDGVTVPVTASKEHERCLRGAETAGEASQCWPCSCPDGTAFD